jgi:hypothetical protein
MGKFLLSLAIAPAFLFGQSTPVPAPGTVAPPATTIDPLTVPKKFESRLISTVGPTKLIVVAALAAYDQGNQHPERMETRG